MIHVLGDANTVALFGLLGGIALGLAARIGRFCTLGAIEDLLYAGDPRRLRMWGVAIALAILGSHAAIGLGLLDIGQTAYTSLVWSPLGSVIGGLLFGYGMAISGNCGYGALARLGGGDMRAFVIVLVMALSAAVALSGPLARLRLSLFPLTPADGAVQSLSPWIAGLAGLPVWAVGVALGALLLGASLFAGAGARASRAQLFWGALVGATVTSGWVGTQWVAANGFGGETVVSHTFARPLADTLLYLMTASGTSLSFGVGSVFGVLLGAFAGSLIKGHFRWEACEDPRELKRQILGAALMGPGAVIAFGCSVGQGISAFSVLAFSAPLTCLAIFAGAAVGLRQLIAGFAPSE